MAFLSEKQRKYFFANGGTFAGSQCEKDFQFLLASRDKVAHGSTEWNQFDGAAYQLKQSAERAMSLAALPSPSDASQDDFVAAWEKAYGSND